MISKNQKTLFLSLCFLAFSCFQYSKKEVIHETNEWTSVSPIRERYIEVSSSNSVKNFDSDSFTVKYLIDQLNRPVMERHPFFRCKMILNEISPFIQLAPDQIWEKLKPISNDFIPRYINYLENNIKVDPSVLKATKEYLYENMIRDHSRLCFMFLELKNISETRLSDVVVYYDIYTISTSNVFPLAMLQKDISDFPYVRGNVNVGVLEASERVLVPMKVTANYSYDHMNLSDPAVIKCIIPLNVRAVDRINGRTFNIGLRGQIDMAEYLIPWVYVEG
jgi:hypothetical protein